MVHNFALPCGKPVENFTSLWKTRLYQKTKKRTTDTAGTRQNVMLDSPTVPHAILKAYLLNKGKENMTPEDTLNHYNTLLANIYKRFAENNINVLSVPQPRPQPDELEACVVVIEYMYQRPRDDKIIWPKAAVCGRTIIDALENAEEIVDAIRSK